MRRVLLLFLATVGIGGSVAYAATLSVGSGHLWAGGQTLTKATCTLQGTSSTTDTYVDEQNPNSSFGSSTTLSVSPKSGKRNWMLIRFDLSSCSIPATGGADSATLSLRITSAPGSSQTLDVSTIGSTWSGSTTWNTVPSTGSSFASITTGTTSNVTKSVTVTADVDALIKNSSANYGWLISEASSSANVTTVFGAAENATTANQPQLVINYEK
ncbi:MAG TPA: DNRLRE domain-containing protein [Gaiellaceae bacterium]